MKTHFHIDKHGSVSEVVTKEEVEKLTLRANACTKELLEVLAKHQCRIQPECYGEERTLVPLNKNGQPYILEESIEKFPDSVHIVSFDFDGPTFLDAINEAYKTSKEKS